MPSHSKRSPADYEREIEEAARRMKKYPEHLKAARNNKAWNNFLLDVVGVKPKIIDSNKGDKFWNDVRNKIEPVQAKRRNLYQEARQVGMTSKMARRIRDWSESRATQEIESWQARH